MMIESMGGKSAALHGITHDCTPFKFSEEDPAAAYMGECLIKGTISNTNGTLNESGIPYRCKKKSA